MLCVGSMTLMLAACATSTSVAVKRDLPAEPSWVAPVSTPLPKAGENTLAVAARERAAKAKANKIIASFRTWYEQVRKDYAGKQP